MSRNLCCLNLILLALAVFTGFQLRGRWRAVRAREVAEFNHQLPPIPALPFTATPVRPATMSANYAAIAQNDLWDRSRNPKLPMETIPPAPKPPMPPLPVYYGAMNLGDGPMAILSENSGSAQRTTRPGEMIGPFKLIDITRQDLTLEWNGETMRRSVDELSNHTAASRPEAAFISMERTDAPTPHAQAQLEPLTPKGQDGDGFAGVKVCQLNDSIQYGAVQGGLRKTEIKTPFGSACLWSLAGK